MNSSPPSSRQNTRRWSIRKQKRRRPNRATDFLINNGKRPRAGQVAGLCFIGRSHATGALKKTIHAQGFPLVFLLYVRALNSNTTRLSCQRRKPLCLLLPGASQKEEFKIGLFAPTIQKSEYQSAGNQIIGIGLPVWGR